MSWDDQREGRSGIDPLRRDVMKAVGVGSAVGGLGGTAAAASQHENEDTQSESGDDGQAAAGDGATVHTVRTLVGPSTSPDRPADFYFEPTGLHVELGDVAKFVFETPDHNVTSYHPAFGMQRRIPAGVRPFSSPIMGWAPESLPADVSEPPTPSGQGGENGSDENDSGAAAGDASEADAVAVADAVADAAGGDTGDGPEPSTWLYAFEEPGVYDLECAPHEHFGMAIRVVVGDETETDFETSDPVALPEPRAGPVGAARGVLTDPALEPDSVHEAGRVEWADLEVNQTDGGNGEGGSDGGGGSDGTGNPDGEGGTDANGSSDPEESP